MERTIITLPDEQALVARARSEPDAFAALYDHYFPRVYTYMRYRVNDAVIADDLTAQTFEQVVKDLPKYRAEQAPFGAWLFGIAHHVVSRHYRTQRRHHWLSLDAILNRASESPLPEETAIDNETNHQLMEAVARLRDQERDLIALKFAAGLNNRQIASITGLTESNVGVILYRSIKQLRVSLSEQD